MPQDAWKKLIEHLMAERGIKHKSKLADAIGTCNKTVFRWLGQKPAVPEDDSIQKVADWAEMSVLDLRKMWTRFMMEQNGIYEIGPSPASEIAEEASVYGQRRDYLAESADLMKLDMKNVPVDMAPALEAERAKVVEFVQAMVPHMGERITGFRRCYAAAVNTALRTQLPQAR